MRVCTRKSQQAAHDFGDAFTLVDDAVNHLLLELRTWRLFILQELSEIDHTIQRVVDLMRNARGKFTDRRQLGRLIKLALHLFALGFEFLTRREITHGHDHHFFTAGRERSKGNCDGPRLALWSLDYQLTLARRMNIGRKKLANVLVDTVLLRDAENFTNLVIGFDQTMI